MSAETQPAPVTDAEAAEWRDFTQYSKRFHKGKDAIARLLAIAGASLWVRSR